LSRTPNRRRALAVILGAVALAASACAAHAPQDTLNAQGPESRYINRMFFPVGLIALVVFFFVAGMVLYIVIRFRARTDDDSPAQIHGSTPLEFTWTIIPLLLMFGVASLSIVGIVHLYRTPKGQPITFVPASADTPPSVQGQVLDVHVIGHRWWFEYDYPGLGAMQDEFLSPGEQTNTALVTANELVIPAGRQIRLDITSNEPLQSPENKPGEIGPGVIHNFWVPALAGKIYAIPGHITHLNLAADLSKVSDGHPVLYYGQCSEFCGISHANMRIRVLAETPHDFAIWVAQQQEQQRPLTSADQYTNAEAYTGYTLFHGAGTCFSCHTVAGTSAVGRVGPNLTHLESRPGLAGNMLPLDNNTLRDWLRNPQAVKPGANMVIPKLTEAQITALIAYLNTLN
jgi:cytochrome c oxidase subunit II